jgi:hypothetical protein
MTNSHIIYRLQLSRISEMHKEAAALRLANEVPHRHRAGARAFLVRGFQRARSRGTATVAPGSRPMI